MRAKLLFISFFFILLLAGFHAFSTHFYIYWTEGWADHLTHILGAAALCSLGLWLCYSSGLFKRRTPSSKETMLFCIGAAAIIGIGWEVFEYFSGIVAWSPQYVGDTVGDLLSDVGGGLVAGVIVINKKLYE